MFAMLALEGDQKLAECKMCLIMATTATTVIHAITVLLQQICSIEVAKYSGIPGA